MRESTKQKIKKIINELESFKFDEKVKYDDLEGIGGECELLEENIGWLDESIDVLKNIELN